MVMCFSALYGDLVDLFLYLIGLLVRCIATLVISVADHIIPIVILGLESSRIIASFLVHMCLRPWSLAEIR